MSLQKQLVHLNLTGGLQTKDDSFLVIPSKLAVANNVEFDDASTVKTRGGLVEVSLSGLSVLEALSNARRAITHNGQLIIEADSGNYRVTDGGLVQIYPIESSTTRGARVFPRASMVTRRDGSVSASTTSYPLMPGDVDTATIGNKQFLAWETRDPSTGTNTIRFQIQDVLSGKVIREGLLNTLAGKVRSHPRVVTYGSDFILYHAVYTAGANTFEVRRIAWNASTGAVSKVEASVITSSASGTAPSVEYDERNVACFDVAVDEPNGNIGLVLRDIDGPGTLRLRALSTSDYYTVTQSRNVAPASWPRAVTAATSVNNSNGDALLNAFYSEGTNTYSATGLNVTTGAAIATAVVGTAGAGDVAGRSAAWQEGDYIYLAWDARTATNEQSTLRVSKFSITYGTLSECSAFAPWFIAGRVASVSNRLYLPMMHSAAQTSVNNTFYVVDFTSIIRNVGVASNNEPPHVLARIDPGESPVFLSTWRDTNRVPGLPTLSATSSLGIAETGLVFSYPKFEADYVVAGTSNDTAVCVSTALITIIDAGFGTRSQLGQVEVNGVAMLAGACPMLFDGTAFVEEGFHHPPWIVPATATPGVAGYGPFPVGDVTFCVTYGWQDDAGNWHESAPSNEVTVTFAGLNVYCNPTIVLPPTQKKGARLRIYRTKATSTDTSLYLTTTASGGFVSLDTDLANSEQLYTAGGVLPNSPAPACRHISVFQRRLVLSGCGDGSRVYWSKQFTPGYGVEFAAGDPTHYTTVPDSAGRVVASAEMDDRLVVLCERAIGLISGSGPAPTGTQGQYSEFSTIITETGCYWYAPKSVARGPEGVWFRSPFGIRLVSRSGTLARGQDGKQVGAEVDGIISGNCVAVPHEGKQQIRFHQTNNTVLVWDYQWLQWSQFSGNYFSFVDAAFADGRLYLLGSSNLRYTSDTSTDDVATTPVTGTIETPWLSFAGIQGYQRLYRLMILGKELNGANGNATFGLTVYCDFDGTTSADSGTATATCTNGRYQVQHHFARQKCEAMKLKITLSAAPGSRVRLTDLTLQVGVKAGYNKLPSSARF